MSKVAERVAKAVQEDPALRPIAERYIRVVQEVAVAHEDQAHPSAQSRGTVKAREASSKKATLVMRFLKQLKAAQSVEEVHAIQERYRQAIARLT